MSTVRRFLLAGVAGVVVLVLTATPAGADELTVRGVDTRHYPEVRLEVLVDGEAPAPADFHVRENDVAIPAVRVRPLPRTTRPVGAVLVVDTSGSMRSQGAMDHARAAAREFIAAKAPNEWIALVSFASQPLVRSDFTQDAAVLEAAVADLVPLGETALWDALTLGARLYEKRPDLQPNVVLLSDGADTVSAGTEGQAVAALTTAHVAVFAVGVASKDFNPGHLESLVRSVGGSVVGHGDPAGMAEQFRRARAALENQYEVVYTSPGKGGSLTVDLSAGGESVQVLTRTGTEGVAPEPTVVSVRHGLLFGLTGKLLILLLATLVAGLFVFVLLLIFVRTDETIEGRLGYYGSPAEVGTDDGPGSLAESNLVQRAVDITGKMAARARLLDQVEGLLVQANLPLRPAEAVFFYGVGVTLVGLLALLGAPSLPVGITAVGVVAAAPVVAVKALRRRRLRAFEAQLPDTLNLLSGSLRAGYSFLQGVEAVAAETTDPMARELRRVLTEARLGRPLEEALAETAARMESRDFDWAVLAIRIQREVGGNLAELLQTVADTMLQRGRLRGEIKALTAEGRLSAVIMGLLPVGLGLFMFSASPDYIRTLFDSVVGWAMAGGSVALAVAGFAWLQKIIKIEV